MDSQKMFIFNGYDVEQNGESQFHYTVKSEDRTINFTEKLVFPNADFSRLPQDLLKNLLNNLSLMLGISYWKLYCPKNIEIKNNFLTEEQAKFWNRVYTKGLGEFFYRNKIDFRGLVHFPYSERQKDSLVVSLPQNDKTLLMLGGGKDSIVSAELLKEHKKNFTAFVVNDYSIQKEIINLLGIDAIFIKREIDPKLLELNQQQGTYNGHVPVSAIYAFITLLAAALYDYRYAISSNEASANYGNVDYLGEEINHQWSKSLEFEKLFQEYVSSYVTSSISYFSLLRPLHEIKIAQLFLKYPKYLSSFSSCNRNFTINKRYDKKWCGSCPKCAFIFATLAAFLSKDQITKIFGRNLFTDETLIDTYKELLGIKNIKPFECVGTPEEVKLAFYITHRKGEFNTDVVMQIFKKEVLSTLTNVEQLEKKLLPENLEGTFI